MIISRYGYMLVMGTCVLQLVTAFRHTVGAFDIQFKRLLGFDYGVNMYVRSAPGEVDMRNAIRDTWAGLSNQMNMKVIFFVGWSKNTAVNQALIDETLSNDDLVVLPMIDHYRNLTLKQLLIFEWHILHTAAMPNPTVFVWMSSDVFVYPTSLLSLIYESRIAEREGVIMAKCMCNGATNDRCRETNKDDWSMYPSRNDEDKYFLSRKVWPYKQFPNHCIGFAAILSPDVPYRIVDLIRQTNYEEMKGHFEDVLFLGVFARHLNMRFVHVPQFCESINGTMQNRTDCACFHSRDNGAEHKVTADTIRGMWHFHEHNLLRHIDIGWPKRKKKSAEPEYTTGANGPSQTTTSPPHTTTSKEETCDNDSCSFEKHKLK